MKFSESFRYTAWVLAVAAAYFLVGKIGLVLAVPAIAAPACTPTGVGLAALLVAGYRVWPGIFWGAFVVGIGSSSDVAVSLGVAAGNTIENLAGAWLVNRYASGRNFFEQPLNVLKFTGLIGLTSLISPPVGVVSVSLSSLAFWANEISTLFIWWLGSMASVLVLTPLLVVWSANPRVRWSRGQGFEFALLTLSLVLAGETVFGRLAPVSAHRYLLPYLCLPFLFWAAFRFSPRETATAILVLAVIAFWGTLHGYGVFVRTVPAKALLAGQGYMVFNSTLALAVAAVVAQRQRAETARLELLRRLDGAQEAERGRISRELHDQLGQELTALKLGLQMVQKQGPFSPPLQECVSQLAELSDSLMRNIHRLAWELRPAVLDDFGLDMALRRYAAEWSERCGVPVDFYSRGMEAQRLPPELETTLYRVAQEVLTNVSRHAKAKRVSVLLVRGRGHVSLTVTDDGQGFDAGAALKARGVRGKLGLLGMQERVMLAGGTVEIESALGTGTTVYLRVPLVPKPVES
jgi:signal transduction histidine kinase